MADSKPADFYISLLDFFAVLLPGATLAYLLVRMPWDEGLVTAANAPLTEPGAKWVAFAVLSYALGHLLHFLGDKLLDRKIYDPLYRPWRRKWEFVEWSEGRLERLKKELGALKELQEREEQRGANAFRNRPFKRTTVKGLIGAIERELADINRAATCAKGRWFWQRCGADTRFPSLARSAGELRDQELGPEPRPVVSLFNWATAWVRLRDAAAGTELDRAGADSKFFRSLALVALAAAVLFALDCQLAYRWALVGVALGLVVPFLGRYLSRRWTAAEQTYLVYVLMHRCPAPKKGASGES